MNAVTIQRTEQGWYLRVEVLDELDIPEEVRHLHFNSFITLIAGLAKIYSIDIKELIEKSKCSNTIKFLNFLR